MLQNLSNWIPHPHHTSIKCLSIFNCCRWAYGCTLTRMPPQILFHRFGRVGRSQINKVLNKLLQILLWTIWTDKGLFDCHVWAQQGHNGATGKTTKWSFPLVSVQQDAGFDWKASNRLIVQPQAHFPLLGEVFSVWLPKVFVWLQQTHDGRWV